MTRQRRSYDPNRRLEASGVPRAGDRSPELELMLARRFGIAAPPTHDYLPQPERFLDVSLGNQELPTWNYRDTIVSAINENPITICLAETGSGKSTQIPQFLLAAGYEVILTQPRRIAAEMLASRIEEETTSSIGSVGRYLTGYKTAERSTLNPDTRVQVVTDGLQLMRELNVFSESPREGKLPRVVIIDEAHERNTNIDVLLAWGEKKLREQSDVRILITSAGINAQRMARFLSAGGFVPPIIEVPGRSYPIERLEAPESTVVTEAVKYARAGKTVLVFLPGVGEIRMTMDAVRKKLSGDKKGRYELLELHGSMSPMEQHRVEIEYPHPKIVFATNVAETSITIPDVDVVIDSGLVREKRINKEGIESLPVVPISRASCMQRGGRCGRTHEGTYVLTRLNERVEHIPFIQRPEFGVPEILRSNVDKTVLSIAGTGMDIKDLRFMDPLDDEVIADSKRALQILGALDENKKITSRGKRMNQFPLRPGLSRMMVYAEENNFPVHLKRYVAAMIAAVDGGGLPDFTPGADRSWRKLTGESSSDYLAQLEIFLYTQTLKDSREVAESGLNPRSVETAHKLYQKLQQRLGIEFKPADMDLKSEEAEKLRECIVAGMIDFVYERSGSDYRRTTARLGRQATLRSIGDRSLIQGKPNLVVGAPFVLESPPDRKLPEKHIIQDVTKTTAQQVGSVAAELCNWLDDPEFIWRGGKPYTRQQKYFRDTVPVGEFREALATWSPELASVIIDMMRRQPGPNLRKMLEAKKTSELLHHMSGTVIPIHNNQLTEFIETAAGVTKRAMVNKPMNTQTLDLSLASAAERIVAMLPDNATIERIRADSPEHITFEGIELELGYRSGKPYIAKITDEIKENLRTTSGQLRLPDGRDVLIPHKIGRNSKRMTIDEFRRA